MKDTSRGRAGFTLVEMMIVITIIAALLAIMIPSIRHFIDVAKNDSSRALLNQVHAAVVSYKNKFGVYPWYGVSGSDTSAVVLRRLSPYSKNLDDVAGADINANKVTANELEVDERYCGKVAGSGPRTVINPWHNQPDVNGHRIDGSFRFRRTTDGSREARIWTEIKDLSSGKAQIIDNSYRDGDVASAVSGSEPFVYASGVSELRDNYDYSNLP